MSYQNEEDGLDAELGTPFLVPELAQVNSDSFVEGASTKLLLASIGAAGIPWAGILILTTVFLSIGLPIEAIWIILAVDRLLDMFRTAVNVWGDLLTAKVIDTFYVKNLDNGKTEKLKLKVITQKN